MRKQKHKDLFGLNVMLQGGAAFDVFAAGFHHHWGKDKDEECQIRHVISVTVMGISFMVGIFRVYE